MYREALLQGRTGSVMRALSALDIALWDLNARSAEMPLFAYLGCWTRERVPAYASGGYYLDGKTPQHLGEELASYVQQGFRAVKMKVGRLTPDEEEVRIRAARDAIGPGVHLMLDANNAWSDLPTALLYCERYQKYSPYWIEEPFSPDDLENHARLSARCAINVATGEIEAGRWRFKEILDKGAAVILQADAAVCGGISEWRRIARYVEYFPDDKVLNFRKLLNRQLEAKEGHLLLPQTPGLGFEFDESSIAKFGLNGPRPWAIVQ
jgi:L-alanine-DL-glutamate epimerase-like enolase superfamily enzyme